MFNTAYHEDENVLIAKTLMPYLRNKNFIHIGTSMTPFSKQLEDLGFNGLFFQSFPFFHEKPVPEKSLDKLVRQGIIANQVGILKTEAGSNNLKILSNMNELTAEVIYCDFLMPEADENGDANPYQLIKKLENLGFKYYLAVKRTDEFKWLSLMPDTFLKGQKGHLIFINTPLIQHCWFQLKNLIELNEMKLFEIIHKINIEDEQQKAYTKRLKEIFHNRVDDILKIACVNHFYRANPYSSFNLKLQEGEGLYGKLKMLKSFFRPRLNLSETHIPKAIVIPDFYHKEKAPKEAPLISIVTPSYNQGKFLERTIKSVLEQSYPNLEYIIQDGGSSDSSVNVIQEYSDQLKHWESKPDKGQSNAINLGFQHATGEIMAYLNSDDLLLAGSLNYVANYFKAHPEVDVVYGHRILIDEFDHEIGRWVLPKHDNHVLKWADYVPQETLFWRRSIWEKAGGRIDESFQFAMDWDLILRFIEAGATFVRLPRFLGAFRLHSVQKSQSRMEDMGQIEMARLRQRCHGRVVGYGEVRRHLYGYLLRHLIYQKLYRLGFLKY